MGRFEGKTVIVTGAGGGIGRCHALAFAREGANVVVNDLGVTREGARAGQPLAEAVAEEIRRQGGRAVADMHSVAEREGAEGILHTALEAFGRVDVLVNNAGILRDRTILKMSDEEWDAVIAVHLRGTFLCTQVVARQLVEQGEGGAIINTSSTSGLWGNFGQANYGAAKAGIAGFTFTAALEFARYGIRVNAVVPVAKTRMTEDISSVPEALKPEHISPLVLYLASDLAKGVTGRIFGIYGGQVQEYYLEATPGVRKEGGEPWTPEEIAHRWREITARRVIPATPEELAALERLFTGVFPAAFVPEQAADLDACIHFYIWNGPDYTVTIHQGRYAARQGLEGQADAIVEGEAKTIHDVFSGLADAREAFWKGRLKLINAPVVQRFQQALRVKMKD